MNTVNKLNPLLKKIKARMCKKTIPVIELVNFELAEKIKSEKVTPLLDKMKQYGVALSHQEQAKRISYFAITTNSPEIIHELVSLGIDIDQKVDHLETKTILASITQYPYYHELFRYLIDAGANPYCNTVPGDKDFLSNALYRSTTYDEYLNILYLIEKKWCSYQDGLEACYTQDKLHMLGYFLEVFPLEERHTFKSYVEKTPRTSQAKVLEIINRF